MASSEVSCSGFLAFCAAFLRELCVEKDINRKDRKGHRGLYGRTAWPGHDRRK